MSDRIDLQAFSALILAGGLGTRLQSLIPGLPKVLYPIGDKPFITLLLDQLIDAGFACAYLSVGHLADRVKETLGSQYGPLQLIYSQEKALLGTGGAVYHALPKIAGSHLVVMNGDSYLDVALPDFIDTYRRQEGISGAIAIKYEANTGRYGRIQLSASNRIINFEEKGGEPAPGWINAGIYVFNKNDLARMNWPPAFSLERQLLPALVARGMVGYPVDRTFIDIGTPQSFQQARIILKGM